MIQNVAKEKEKTKDAKETERNGEMKKPTKTNPKNKRMC